LYLFLVVFFVILVFIFVLAEQCIAVSVHFGVYVIDVLHQFILVIVGARPGR
jgi:hypothetical protein